MKLINGILGCALVTGLMAFAPSQSQAGGVVGEDGQLYSPLNLKLVISTQKENGKIGKATVTSKTVLKELGFNNEVVLALSLNEDVVVINKKSGVIFWNLTTTSNMTVNADEYISNQNGPSENGKYSYDSTGLIDIDFYIDNEESYDYFSVSGAYSASLNASKYDKNGQQKLNTKGSAKQLSGSGYFSEIYSYDDTVVTGSASVKGSGKVGGLL